MQKLTLLSVLAILCLKTIAQSPPIKPLTIGDTVPDITINNIINYKTTSAKLSDFKGKLVILDFWATNCTACIQKFPMLDSMENAFRDKLAVLLVAAPFDKKDGIKKVFERLEVLKKSPLSLKTIIGDTVANSLFPHIYIPHYVWLDSNLKVIAITGTQDVTPEKIADMLSGKFPQFSYKQDLTDFDSKQPIFLNGNGGSGESMEFRSLLTGYIPGLPTGSYITKDSSGNYRKILQTNQPVLELLKRANDYFYDSKRFHFPENDINVAGKTEEWIIKNSYTYELYNRVPIPKETALQHMKEDIKRYLGYSAEIKKIPTQCYVISIDSVVLKKHYTEGGSKANSLSTPEKRQLQNRPVSDIAEFLDNISIIPVVDESHFVKNIDLTLSEKDARDIESLKLALSRYGIYLTRAVRSLDNFFIYYHQSN